MVCAQKNHRPADVKEERPARAAVVVFREKVG